MAHPIIAPDKKTEVCKIPGVPEKYRGQQGFSEVRRNYDVEKGAESVILDFELYGNTFHAEIPLEWEGV